jgi:hypothetical protein
MQQGSDSRSNSLFIPCHKDKKDKEVRTTIEVDASFKLR